MNDFDCIIMNPPYDKNTHLKILDNVIEEFKEAEVVNLSPIRWLQDPTADYKKNSDFKKFENIRHHIEELDEIDTQDAERQFNIGLPFNLGLYHLTKNGGWQHKENKLLKKMIDKIETSLKDHIVVDDLSGISLLISLMTGGRNGGLKYVYINGFNLPKHKAFYTDRKNETTGETYLEYRQKSAWGNLGVKSECTNIKFNTKEERQNFYDSYNTKTLKWMFGAMTVDVHVHPQFLPWLGDYTRPWTDQDLYGYFDLTSEEIKEIEETMCGL